MTPWAFVNQKSELTNWLQSNRRLVITTEILFLVAFGLWQSFRAANPEIVGTEKPMELMFINGIMNSPAFPSTATCGSPGYSISYYYFGYVMASMLATVHWHAGDYGVQPDDRSDLWLKRSRRLWDFV